MHITNAWPTPEGDVTVTIIVDKKKVDTLKEQTAIDLIGAGAMLFERFLVPG